MMPAGVASTRSDSLLDRVAPVLTAGCAIHCLLTPLLIAVVPLFGILSLSGRTESFLLVASLSLTLTLLRSCYGRRHTNLRPLQLFFGGAFLLCLSQEVGQGHTWLEAAAMTAAAVQLLLAQWVNRRACHACERCQAGETKFSG